MNRLLLSMVILILFVAGCGQASGSSNVTEETELTISAAASMMASLNEITEVFEEENPDIKITYNFGGSGTLRKQIEQGAPIDLFFSASKKDYQLLEEGGFVNDGSAIFRNKLVFLQQEDGTMKSLEDFINSDGKIAIGTPEAVPAGTYAEQALEKLGVWEQLQGRIVFTKDVRQVLNAVKEGGVDLGLVYSSDLYGEENVEIAWEVDHSLHEKIEYFVASLKNDQKQEDDVKAEAVERFYQYVQKEDSMKVFAKYGFDTKAPVNQ
ncbi:molybdate ABC transporter substrate-binding protein [Oceanobacillus chungangensis]|uniref:Molybdate ABC transporter substrate-binding protein n=1 Tax=Oceanobacillus chungangensis TaxID=1229152 RepID=A0A3D8PID9_9BACI|nr:molybdate ABC transporter substrate-binding protein [Oceanobacillus chungangensis]RDW15412.1 molybdate ABC transporter substrate-binding protein [Oceanobacillus chungangensis]